MATAWVALVVCVPGGFAAANETKPAAMLWISTDGSGQEVPTNAPGMARAKGFWIDRKEVSNEEFRRFVRATGYVTTAETSMAGISASGASEFLGGGSLVRPPGALGSGAEEAEPLWVWRRGACWRFPEGPGSSVEHRLDQPVVHISWRDAAAYAAWAGKRLPREQEWVAAVGSKPLAGSVWQWCADGPTDGVAGVEETRRVLRGGASQTGKQGEPAGLGKGRLILDEGWTRCDVGFRCVRDIQPGEGVSGGEDGEPGK